MPLRYLLNFQEISFEKENRFIDLTSGYFSLIMGIATILSIPVACAKPSPPNCTEHFPAATKIVKLGMSTALSGPIQYLGLLMSQGVQQKIAEVNCEPYWRKLGIRFELIVLDDSYDPDLAAQNTKVLIDNHKVIAIVGNVGTPTANKAWTIANDKKVIFYGAYTGSNILRTNPPAPYVFNYRPSYDQEMEVIVRDIIGRGISPTYIGLFLQNDAFGNSGLASLRKALGSVCGECQENILQMRYERNSLKTNRALEQFIATDVKPRVIILVGSMEPTLEFIRFAQLLSPGTCFYSLSFTSASALREKLNGSTLSLILSQIVPEVITKTIRTTPNPIEQNEVYREGYLATQLLLDAMKKINGPITSETLRTSLINLDQQLPGIKGDHQMMNEVWLAKFNSDIQILMDK